MYKEYGDDGGQRERRGGCDFEFCDFICMTQNNDVIVMIKLLIWLGADLEHIWTIIVSTSVLGRKSSKILNSTT